MKKMIIALIVLAVLAAGSLTAFFIAKGKHDRNNQEAADRAADYQLFSFDSDSITDLTLELEDGTYHAVQTEGKWASADPDFKMNASYLQGICTYLCDLTAEKDYGEATDSKKTEFGLDNPTVITASDGSEEYKLYVGNASPTGDTYYVMTGNKSKVYAIDSSSGSAFKANRFLLKDRYLLNVSSYSLDEIQLIRDGETAFDITYSNDTGTWSLSDEYSHLTTSGTKCSSMVTIITKLEAQEFFEENLEDYSKYGFDKPHAELIITEQNGNVSKFLYSFNGEKNSDYVYVLDEATRTVAAYSAFDSDFIDYTAMDLLSGRFCDFGLANLDGLDINFEGTPLSFDIDMENSTVKCGEASFTAADTEQYEAFTNFYNSISYMEFTEVDTEASPELKDTVLSAEFHTNDGSGNLLAELCDTGSDSYYIFLNGEYSGAIISSDAIYGEHGVKEFFDKFSEYIAD